MKTTYSIIADVNWKFGDDSDPNLRYCQQHATFKHYEACEFILHVGNVFEDEEQAFEDTLDEMKQFGCTQDFIDAFVAAKDSEAQRVLFYA